MLFLSARSLPVGGGIGPLSVLTETNTLQSLADVQAAVQGRDVLLVTHGFNVNQPDGLQKLSDWANLLQLGNTVVLGLLWPGDARWIHVVDYPIEGNEAVAAGDIFATAINANLAGALSISFASHSLGARVVLQTISGLSRQVSHLLIMAGAIDNTCLTSEYAKAAASVKTISLLASRKDTVLEWAFPPGNLLSGLFARGVPYVRKALGREGPSAPYPDPDNIHADWQIPDDWNFNHSSYLPAAPPGAGFPAPVAIPADNPAPPPPETPFLLEGDPNLWQPAWSAAFQTTRWS